jgi:hypothetical protein
LFVDPLTKLGRWLRMPSARNQFDAIRPFLACPHSAARFETSSWLAGVLNLFLIVAEERKRLKKLYASPTFVELR